MAVIVLTGLNALSTHQRRTQFLLGAFFILSGLVAIDTLLFWGDGVKHAAFTLSPILLTVFSFSAFVLGPVFYWFTLATTNPKIKFDRWFYPHLLPAVLTPLYLYLICHQHPIEVQRDLILNLGIYSLPEAHFALFVVFKKAAPLIYALMSLQILLGGDRSKDSRIWNVKHLPFIVVSFCIIQLWSLTTHLLGLYLPANLSDQMGLLGNYMALSLFISLVAMAFRASQSSTAQRPPAPEKLNIDVELRKQSKIIEGVMEDEKPYLNSQLTLSRFSDSLTLTPRQVSTAINRCFHQNFQEYINRYRIEEAKQLLGDAKNSELTIVQIGELCGFNSKVTFNRLFKKFALTAPNAYRQQVMSDNASSQQSIHG